MTLEIGVNAIQTLRASGTVLTGTPVVSSTIFVTGAYHAALTLSYERGDANGQCDFYVEISPFSDDDLAESDEIWARAAVRQIGTLTPGTEVSSDLQQYDVSFKPLTANNETVVFALELAGVIERMRVYFSDPSAAKGDAGMKVGLR